MFKDFKIWLIKRDLRQVDVARRLGITKQYLHLVVTGQRPGRSVRKKLVELGVPKSIVNNQKSGRAA